MSRWRGAVVGARRLRRPGSRRTVLVRVGMPRRSGRDWVVPFQLRGLAPSRIRYSYGVDALQALMLAFEGIRVTLETRGKALTWLGEPGESGFYRFVPDLGIPPVRRRPEKAIDREMRAFLRKLERRYRRRRLRQASSVAVPSRSRAATTSRRRSASSR
ncbi:MAG: DUF6968 family protein [Candidatus Rokuibacteriota bacterium]